MFLCFFELFKAKIFGWFTILIKKGPSSKISLEMKYVIEKLLKIQQIKW